jgi:hypothetical protein
VEVKKITSKKEMARYGVVNGPAVVTVKYKLKSEGSEPSLDVVKEWIKEL